MGVNDILYNLFVLPPDVAMLKFLIFVLLIAFLMLLLPRLPVFKDNQRAGKVLALLIALIAVMGMGSNTVIGIITGYSWTILGLFVLLPIIGLILLLTIKGQSAAISLLKAAVTAILLVTLDALLNVMQNYNSGFLYLGQGSGASLGDIFGIVTFVVMIVMFYYIFELFSRLIFTKKGND